MATRHNIRQRRRDRIRQLLEHDQTDKRGLEWTSPQAQEPSPSSEWNDPEQVWKLQQKRMDEYYRAQHEAEAKWGQLWSPKMWMIKWVISAILFALCWGAVQTDRPWANEAKRYIRTALHEDFDFQRLEQWYSARFDGYPSLIPAFRKGGGEPPAEHANSHDPHAFVRPVNGSVTAAFTEQHPGVVLSAPPGEQVVNIDVGRVVFVGVTRQTGLTVIVQHADQMRTVYGFLGETNLKPNDWVKEGGLIGTVGEDPHREGAGRVYFSIKKADQFIDPLEVMTFR